MNAINLCEKAKLLDSHGYKIPAVIYWNLSQSILSPALFLQYKRENKVNDYIKQISEDLENNNNNFSEKLKNFDNTKIYGFDVKYVDGSGIVPYIKYIINTDF